MILEFEVVFTPVPGVWKFWSFLVIFPIGPYWEKRQKTSTLAHKQLLSTDLVLILPKHDPSSLHLSDSSHGPQTPPDTHQTASNHQDKAYMHISIWKRRKVDTSGLRLIIIIWIGINTPKTQFRSSQNLPDSPRQPPDTHRHPADTFQKPHRRPTNQKSRFFM